MAEKNIIQIFSQVINSSSSGPYIDVFQKQIGAIFIKEASPIQLANNFLKYLHESNYTIILSNYEMNKVKINLSISNINLI